MKLIRLAAWTLWFSLTWIALAHAGPIVAAIGAIASTISAIAGTALGKLLLGVALNVASSLLQKALQKKELPPGIQADIQVGGVNSLSFIVGRFATAGSLDYVGTWGSSGKTPNAILTQVISLSDLPVHSISNRVWINGEECHRNTEITSESPELGQPFDAYIRTHQWLHGIPYDGTQTEPPYLVGRFTSGERAWSGDMIGRGIAYYILSATFNREYHTGIPQAVFEVEGIRLYDPRKDSSVGGDGSHRWGQEGTYEFSANPAVIIYNILRGIYYQGEWVYGPEVPAAALPVANWFAAMNECDREIPLLEGGMEPQFRAGLEIKAADSQPVDVIEELLTACNGRIAEIGGVYKIHVGAPGLPVYFFSDDDIEVMNSPQSFEPFPGYEQTFNTVTATYPEPTAAWELKEAPRYVNDAAVADDGEPRLAGVTYNSVPYATQVQRLMRSMADDNRRFRNHQITLPPEAWLLEPLDVVAWSSNRNGYIEKHFVITGMDDLPNVNQNVALHEVDPSDYDWSPAFEKDWSVGSLTPIDVPPQLLTGWQVFPAIIYDDQGRARRPSIRVVYDGGELDVRAVRVQVRPAGLDEVMFDAEQPYGEIQEEPKSVILNGVFTPATNYQVRGIFVPYSGRATEWSAWLAVTTPDVRLGEFDVYLEGMIEGLQEFIDEATEWVSEDINAIWGVTEALSYDARAVHDDLMRNALNVADQDLANYDDKEVLSTGIKSTADDVRAEFREEIIVATGPNSALAQAITALEVEVGDNIASAIDMLSTEIQTVDGKTTTNAQAITSVQADLGTKASANALSELTTTVTEQGGTITSQGSAITAVQNALPGKADASTVTSLTNRVSSAEGTITSQGSAITSVQNQLPGKASVSSVNALSNTVTQQGNTISAQGNSITSLNATVNDVSANANFRMQVTAGPSGYSSRIGAQARVGGSGTYRQAAWFLDVPSSTAQPTRFVVNADQFAVTNGSQVAYPMVFQGGTLYLNDAVIGSANIGELTVGTSKIANNAVTAFGGSTSSDYQNISGWTTVNSVNVNMSHSGSILVGASATIKSNQSGEPGVWLAEMRVLRNGGQIAHDLVSGFGSGEGNVAINVVISSGTGNQHLEIQARTRAGTNLQHTGSTLSALVAKK